MRSAFGVATLAVLSGDQGQFIQNFLSVIGILFSLLIGNTYAFCYNQQVMVYMALFEEVSVAKALLEQATLVCQGRPSYAGVLDDVQLRRPGPEARGPVARRFIIHVSRATTRSRRSCGRRRSARPAPSMIRCGGCGARGASGSARCSGSSRRCILRCYFAGYTGSVRVPPAVGGRGDDGGCGALRVEAAMFALMTAALTLTLGVVVQLWRPRGSAYSVDAALAVMVEGLEDELQRAAGGDPVEPRGPAAGAKV